MCYNRHMPIIAKVVDFDVHCPMFLRRFHKKYSMPDGIFGCWIWKGAKSCDGYGKIRSGIYKSLHIFTASRISHEMYKGVVPANLQIDHLCRNTSCVNPFCIEVVTSKVNCKRRGFWQKIKTHCKYGHEFTEENTLIRPSGCRECRTCKQAYLDKEKAARKAAREERKLLSLN